MLVIVSGIIIDSTLMTILGRFPLWAAQLAISMRVLGIMFLEEMSKPPPAKAIDFSVSGIKIIGTSPTF